jgi:hypothetical protein
MEEAGHLLVVAPISSIYWLPSLDTDDIRHQCHAKRRGQKTPSAASSGTRGKWAARPSRSLMRLRDGALASCSNHWESVPTAASSAIWRASTSTPTAVADGGFSDPAANLQRRKADARRGFSSGAGIDPRRT